ncbi:MAG: glucose 1-dehydrogenase [Candidatus Obscuribacterales bacterium]|nr:glucose 1-dehydrogenase [Candidatus Obscuribacterales bacterium]
MNALQTKIEATATKKLAGKVALVTGGSRGIGAAIALRLAEHGATVTLTYNNNKGKADEVVEQITKLGSNAVAFKADVASEKDNAILIDLIERSIGKIDILVNNAAVWDAAPIDQIDVDHYDRVFDTNVKGVIATTMAALPKIKNGGRIINISSVAAEGVMKTASVYSASKAALNTLTRIWAQELGERKITVNGVAPGTTATDMLIQALPEDVKQEFISKTALGRLAEPVDIANVVAFLASDDGAWITGQTIRADGGIVT